MNNPEELILTATGDTLFSIGLPQRDEDFNRLSTLLNRANARFTNLEGAVREPTRGAPSAQSGGTWCSAPPGVLQDVKDYGFNLVAWANNHTLDYLYGGLEATRESLNAYGFAHSGAGLNLAEAEDPCFIECGRSRVALISATSTFHPWWIAGDQRRDIAGRPGINPLRFETRHHVSREKFESLKSIAESCGVNDPIDLAIKEGFIPEPESGAFRFGADTFNAVDSKAEEGTRTAPLKRDLERFARIIRRASRQADVVLVSIHSHEMRGLRKDLPAGFLEVFARHCIECGAHSVIGHGPHILRGIEIYRNRPIFYSLGNFIFQNESVEKLPADFFEMFGVNPEGDVVDAIDSRSRCDTRGLGAEPKIWHSVIPLWKLQNGELTHLELHPISLGFRESRWHRGRPRLTDDITALEEIKQLSREMGTDLAINNGVATLQLKS